MTVLPPELGKFSHLRHIQSHCGGREYSAECPVCGDYGHRQGTGKPDRFRMWPGESARAWCRQCGHFEWADSGDAWTKEQYVAAIKHRQELLVEEQQRKASLIAALQEEAYWKGWHENMGEKGRERWRREGIADSMQNWFTLGHVNHKRYSYKNEVHEAPALTIPYRLREGVVNVQFRLLDVSDDVGKYRFTSGLPTSLFLTEPDKEMKGTCLVTEGAKKSIVSYAHMGHMYDHVIGLPSKVPASTLLDELKESDFSEIFVVLDPDAHEEPAEGGMTRAEKVCQRIGERAKLVSLPAKIDDLLTSKLMSPKQASSIIRQGRRVVT